MGELVRFGAVKDWWPQHSFASDAVPFAMAFHDMSFRDIVIGLSSYATWIPDWLLAALILGTAGAAALLLHRRSSSTSSGWASGRETPPEPLLVVRAAW